LGTIGGFYGKPQSLIYNKPLDPSATLPFTAGHRHSCSVWGQGAPVCWGDNLYGQLGGPLEPIVPVPQTGVSLPGVAVQLVSGMRHSCAMLLNGQVLCWGEGGYGQLGHGSDTDSKTPVQTAIPASTVLGIAAGGAHGCLRTWAGEVHCWGLNGRGQLGVGSHTQSNMPMPVPLQGIVDIAAGAEHTCAVLSDGTVWCWGANDLGQLGLGFAGQDQLSPVQVTGLP
jgi:alpha-tubulin suppressor-like RCC1 family protein